MTWESLQSLPQRQRRSRVPENDRTTQALTDGELDVPEQGVADDDERQGSADAEDVDVRDNLRSGAEQGCSYECETHY